ncbi:hypothetical protein F2Q69_00030792 [Brassica cretica]|uniref:Septum-promoting GTP-binding protein 1 n=1 Tax=Brassica cretica TaxID=69181 RepID=A0A8S9RTT8_BRACR|nr:hypothetical protein F2Q69_00030792 [Brassica cretica]
MAQSCLKIVRLNNLKNRVNRRILILRRFTRLLWSRIVACAPRKSRRYLLLSRAATPSPSVSRPQPPPIPSLDASGGEAVRRISVREHDNNHRRSDSDLVSLKISLLGDPEIGKTCFLAKYVGEDEEVEMRILDKGISCTDKMLSMGGARISYSIWELEGAERSRDLIPTACKDSVAILFMFDLTSRCTLNSVISWYQQARMSNQAKYVGEDEEVEMRILDKGISCTDKMLSMGGARISYSIWELEGAERSRDLIPTACKDSVAILFMFDLTSRCTLNSVISWYQQARMSNQTAIPVMVGTKFDEFIQLPIDLQWTIASQARTYAKALNATLFFSSASYNINVNKIFKFVTAKLFDLPWTVERNLTIGEPLIDF